MIITVILNGGLKSCCRILSTDMVRTALEGWFKDQENVDVDVLDRAINRVELDQLALTAERYLHDKIYPLIYLDNVLISFGKFPEYRLLQDMVKQPNRYALTEQDIVSITENLDRKSKM